MHMAGESDTLQAETSFVCESTKSSYFKHLWYDVLVVSGFTKGVDKNAIFTRQFF